MAGIIARLRSTTRRRLPSFHSTPSLLTGYHGRRLLHNHSSDHHTATLKIPVHNLTVPTVWLRDACACPRCVHPSTRQKLRRTSDFVGARPVEGGVRYDHGEGVLRVRWAEGAEGHESVYRGEWLEGLRGKTGAGDEWARRVTWDAKRLGECGSLYVPYAALAQDAGVLTAIEQLVRYGIVLVTGVPHEETSDERCELRKVVRRFGEVRETFYGGTWDVRSVRESRNIAYTSLELGMHMDLLYFEHPPRFQILHCLRNRVKGGQSLFLDALHAAHQLRADDPKAFNTLASTPVPFHYVNDGHHLRREHPTIELAPASPPEIAYVNYSPPFQARLPLSTPPGLYAALRGFARIVDDPRGMFEYALREGDAVVFDNRRVLHARRGFEEREREGGEGETQRWLKGAYFEADGVLDRGRLLREREGEV